jgi:hypothetical protein
MWSMISWRGPSNGIASGSRGRRERGPGSRRSAQRIRCGFLEALEGRTLLSMMDLAFNAATPGTIITDQYCSDQTNQVLESLRGLQDDTTDPLVVKALPGAGVDNVASISNPVPGREFPSPYVKCSFKTPVDYVSVLPGLMNTWSTADLVMDAYNANNGLVGEAKVTLSTTSDLSDPFDYHNDLTVSATAGSGNIAYFTVSGSSVWPVYIASIYFDVPATQQPDFTLNPVVNAGSETEALGLAPGGSVTDVIKISRLAGSTGGITFQVSKNTPLPPGVTPSFSPSTAYGTSTVMTLSAAPSAPTNVDWPGTSFRIVGTPVDATAGPAPRTSPPIDVWVRSNFGITLHADQSLGEPSSQPALDPKTGALRLITNIKIPITITRAFGEPSAAFFGTISLSTSTLPAGVVARLQPASLTASPSGLDDFHGGGSASSTLTLTCPADTNFKTFPLTVYARADGATEEASVPIESSPGIITSLFTPHYPVAALSQKSQSHATRRMRR